MKVDVLVAEIGSTTTVVNAFSGIGTGCPLLNGQGQSPTTVLEGDVTLGLEGAINNLKFNLNTNDLQWNDMLATSSAAGGLKMTVHGLAYDMTVRAAKEAALGAGAILKFITAGKLRKIDLKKILSINPNIILVAGGVDYGERETSLYNMEAILSLGLKIPVIYAGNIENQEEIKLMCDDSKTKVYIVENVYPKIDKLVIEPTREVIQNVFEEHIIYAPGMSKIRNLITGPIIPTPGAVMEAAKVLKETMGDLMIIDVGGATTDIHSVTNGSEEINSILISPEPEAKRTVEGDLGVYVNHNHIIELIGIDKLKAEFPDLDELLENYKPIPESSREIQLAERLTSEAVLISAQRHVGHFRQLYNATGKNTVAEGKDLTAIKYIIGTGGALTRLPDGKNILYKLIRKGSGLELYPTEIAKVLIDEDYIFASLGVLSKSYPKDSLQLMKNSLRII